MNRIVFLCLFVLAVPGCSPEPKTKPRPGESAIPAPTQVRADTPIQDALAAQLALVLEDKRDLNTFITLNAKGAMLRAAQLDALPRDEQRGVLHGLSVIVKDSIDVAGLPSSAGTRALSGFQPKRDAPTVARLKKAGAIVIGKANMHELGFGVTSNNYAFGPVRNIDNPSLFAGGSSGGTAVALAAGFARLGLGTDTGGSSRIPAALNGVVGFRPTMGRYPTQGALRLSQTRDTVGPMASNVADVALLDAVLSAEKNVLPKVAAKTLRLGVPRAYFYENLDPQVEQLMSEALERFAASGITLIEADLEGVGELNEAMSFPIVLYETAQLLPKHLIAHNIPLSPAEFVESITSPDVKQIIGDLLANPTTEEAYKEALHVLRPKLQALYKTYFATHQVDAVVFPTTPLPARPIEGSDETVTLNGEQVPTFFTYIRNMDPSSNAGVPGLSIPIGRTAQGLSVGMEIEALIGQDRKVFAVGQLLESILSKR